LLVGHRGWMMDDFIGELKRNPATRDRIMVLHAVSDEMLNRLYDACLFTVYPSFYEGYGLPVVESLAHGKICVAANTGSIPEVPGDLCPMLDPLNEAEWHDTLTALIKQGDRRRTHEERIRS